MSDKSQASPVPPATGSPDSPAGPAVKTETKPKTRSRSKTKKLPPYNVILLNDDDHSYEYVITMLGEIFAHPPELGYQMAKAVDKSGRAIVLTTHRELAELKLEQIQSYGADTRISASKGSMSAVIEPAG